METLNQYVNRFDNNNLTKVIIKIGGIIICGTSCKDPNRVTKKDIQECMFDADCQFAYDEDYNLVDPIGEHKIDHIEESNNSLIIHLYYEDTDEEDED